MSPDILPSSSGLASSMDPQSASFGLAMPSPSGGPLGTIRALSASSKLSPEPSLAPQDIAPQDIAPQDIASDAFIPPTFFIAVDGSDNNVGTIDSPFASLQKAINLITSGGTIYLRGGTYIAEPEAYSYVSKDHDGTAANPLVIRPYNDEKAILDGRNLSRKDSTGISIGGSYVQIEGLEFQNSAFGILGYGAQHLKVLNNIVHDTETTGIGIYAPTLGGSSDIQVIGNSVYRANLNNQERSRTSNWGSGITISQSRNAVVTDNKVYYNYGEGITSTLSDTVYIANNLVHDNYSVQLYMDQATNTVFENNLVYSEGNAGFYRRLSEAEGWQPSYGILIANEDYDVNNLSSSNLIRNNIVAGALVGIASGPQTGNNGIIDTLVTNNTFYYGTRWLLNLDPGVNYQNLSFSNNIFYQPYNTPLTNLPDDLSGVNFLPNLWYSAGDASPGAAANPADRRENPLFVNGGGLLAEDYQLQAGSGAQGFGADPSKITIRR
jgi:parallel beta-helix repeat protein